MKIKLLVIGKSLKPELIQWMEEYEKRLCAMTKYERVEIPDVKNAKNLSTYELKNKEAEKILEQIDPTDFVILLDEKGKTYTSQNWAKKFENYQNQAIKQVVFIVGGAFGVDKSIKERANEKLALSAMTFTHQMVRLIFTEQIYRAFTILHRKPYHHE